MMLPIVVAVLEELHNDNGETKPLPIRKISGIQNDGFVNDEKNLKNDHHLVDVAKIKPSEHDSDEKIKSDEMRMNIRRMFLFATCYSSNLGGTGTIIGSGTNLVLQGILNEHNISQDGKYTDLTFATWLAYNFPGMVINGVVVLIYLVMVFQVIPKLRNKDAQPISIGSEENVRRILRAKYEALGPMNFHEIAVSIMFFFVVMLWFFRDPRFIKGWMEYFWGVEVGDSTAAMFVIFLLFIIPKNLDFSKDGKSGKETLLDWKYAQSKMPWGIVLLMGGGFALSDASTKSGLSDWIGKTLEGLEDLPNPVILIILMILTAGVTEVASNAAVANVIIPILIALSERLDVHPLYFTLPAAISCSFAFMLPVATPPNAIVFSTGDLKIMDMIKTGFFLNISCIVVVFCLNITYGGIIFDFDNYEYVTSNSTKYISY
jgi:sodium-dependent dicarboxylate transporter 2/3/5